MSACNVFFIKFFIIFSPWNFQNFNIKFGFGFNVCVSLLLFVTNKTFCIEREFNLISIISKAQIVEFREKIAKLEKEIVDLNAGKPSDVEIESFKQKADGMIYHSYQLSTK